ncbi:rod shape-determining protein MreC [Intrasporangium sp. YIM S08009]|uniref:rod shape-determining protein MreC n=1 Tax=Intrasporangium zincisolvens TaxID=3080018 RepID=UPI002B05FB8B|nr:rod shape-determining protein MreC [Intrasporangium sp. YIM S08009]
MDDRTRRRLLGLLVAATLGLLVADLAGSGVTDAVRRASGVVVGPVQRVLAGASPGDLSRLEAENVRLRAVVADQQRALDDVARLRSVLGAEVLATHAFVPGRVVGTALGPLGGRNLTIDVGSRDGVEPDSTVVAAEGLVGRVVSVSPWTSDVQVLGSTGSVVGVRVGPAGTLATVAAPGTADREVRPRGSLILSFIQPGTPVVGDVVRTLGSVDERPYVAGVVVGTVTDVDAESGRMTRTATVRPAVDADAIDVVAVLVPRARATPRPVQQPATGAATGAGR